MPYKRILSAQYDVELQEVGGGEVIVANSPLAIQKSPGLPAGRAESFPVMGNFRLRATSFPTHRGMIRACHGAAAGMRAGEKNFITAASGFPPGNAGAAAASLSNSSGVQYPNAECSRKRL